MRHGSRFRPDAPNPSFANPTRKRFDAAALFFVGAELLVEQDRREPLHFRLERALAIGFPEELRVAQPGRDDALGVAGDGALVVGLDVDDGEETLP